MSKTSKRRTEDVRLDLVESIRQIVDLSTAADSAAASRAAVPLDGTELAAVRLIGTRGVVRMRDLARGLSILPSSATALIDRLIAKDLVVRERNEADRRVVIVALTAAGKRVFRTANREHLRLCESMLSQFSGAEQGMLLEVMRKLASGPGERHAGPRTKGRK